MNNWLRVFWVRISLETIWFLLASLLVVCVWAKAAPVFQDGIVQYPDEENVQHFEFPLAYTEHVGDATLQLSFRYANIHFTKLHFTPDDCVQVLQINGVDVPLPEETHCDFEHGFVVDVSPYVQAGDNTYVLRLHNYGGPAGLRIVPATTDVLHIIAILLLTILVYAYVFRLQKLFHWPKATLYSIATLLLLGAIVRLYYVLGTPYYMRANDVDGHLEYIYFLLQQKRLPAIDESWQGYQPPLYYFCLSLYAWLLELFSLTKAGIYVQLQWISFACSLVVMAIAGLLGHSTIGKKMSRKAFLLFFALIVSSPALIYFSARINNDVFLAMFGTLAIFFLLYWWQSAKNIWWYSTIAMLCLGYMSKANIVVLFPVVFVLLLLHSQVSWQQKWLLFWRSTIALAICVVLLMQRGSPALESTGVVGNIQYLNPELLSQNSPSNFLVFNPVAILDHPYASPWFDEERRQYFWEYLYKSAFFGEFIPPEPLRQVAITILLLHLLIVPLLFWGIVSCAKRNLQEHLPMLLLFFALLGAHVAFRFLYPFSSSQDFRYSILLVLPVSYFTVFGLLSTSSKLQKFYSVVLSLFCIACLLFILLLVLL